MKRTTFVGAGALALTLLAGRVAALEGPAVVQAPVRASELGLEVDRLSPRIVVVRGGPWDNGIVAIATRKGIVVVDAPFSRRVAGAFREAIQAELKRSDFAFLVDTHEHLCHVGGNEAFADVPIVGHESLRREMLAMTADPGRPAKVCEMGERQLSKVREYLEKADPKKLESPDWAAYEKSWRTLQEDLRASPALTPPTITFEKEMTLHLDDVDVRLDWYGHSHGIGDTVVSVPQENLVLTAGIFYPTHVPSLADVTDKATPAVVDNWFVVMRKVLAEANEETKFLASHGRAVMRKGQYQEFVSYLEGVWGVVRRARAAGKTLEQAKADVPLKAFPAIAKLPNEELRGSEWENLDIHGHNVEHLWKVLDRSPA